MSIWMDELAAFAAPAGGGILLSPARREGRQLLHAQKKAVALPPRTAAEVTLDI